MNAYICNVKSTIRKDRKKLNVLYIVDQNHQRSVIVVDYYYSGYNGEMLIQEGGNYCSK